VHKTTLGGMPGCGLQTAQGPLSSGVGGFQVTGRGLRVARLKDEWYRDLEDPDAAVASIKSGDVGADIFTFWQRLPEVVPKYRYRMERDSIAAIPVTSYDHWFKHQLNSKGRNLIRKSAKAGVVVKEAAFDDDFLSGMMQIFNESKIRQNRPFWHYGKDLPTLKREFSRNIFREELLGAYLEAELIGFIFLAYAGPYAMLTQIISKIAHRDKAPSNALLAKAVQVCADKGVPYLVYAMWTDGGLGHFKRQNGFDKYDLPRYYIPLTLKGRAAVAMNLHHGLHGLVPSTMRPLLMELREYWYKRRCPDSRPPDDKLRSRRNAG
jgi:hypothetical protein